MSSLYTLTVSVLQADAQATKFKLKLPPSTTLHAFLQLCAAKTRSDLAGYVMLSGTAAAGNAVSAIRQARSKEHAVSLAGNKRTLLKSAVRNFSTVTLVQGDPSPPTHADPEKKKRSRRAKLIARQQVLGKPSSSFPSTSSSSFGAELKQPALQDFDREAVAAAQRWLGDDTMVFSDRDAFLERAMAEAEVDSPPNHPYENVFLTDINVPSAHDAPPRQTKASSSSSSFPSSSPASVEQRALDDIKQSIEQLDDIDEEAYSTHSAFMLDFSSDEEGEEGEERGEQGAEQRRAAADGFYDALLGSGWSGGEICGLSLAHFNALNRQSHTTRNIMHQSMYATALTDVLLDFAIDHFWANAATNVFSIVNVIVSYVAPPARPGKSHRLFFEAREAALQQEAETAALDGLNGQRHRIFADLQVLDERNGRVLLDRQMELKSRDVAGYLASQHKMDLELREVEHAALAKIKKMAVTHERTLWLAYVQKKHGKADKKESTRSRAVRV
jgi:hypothetical protein